jgi:hypothetical protein
MYSELLHEGEPSKREAQWRISRVFWSRQNICEDERFIFLVGDALRGQAVC